MALDEPERSKWRAEVLREGGGTSRNGQFKLSTCSVVRQSGEDFTPPDVTEIRDQPIPGCPIHATPMVPHIFEAQSKSLWHRAANGFKCANPDCRLAHVYGMFEGFYELETTGQLTRYFFRAQSLRPL